MLVVRGFDTLTTTQRVIEALSKRSHRSIGGLWGASKGLLIHTLQRHWNGGILVITADDDESIILREDTTAFRPRGSKESSPQSLLTELRDIDDQPDPVTRAERIRTLTALSGPGRPLLISSVTALTQPAPSKRSLGRGKVRLTVGKPADQQGLLEKATAAGLRNVPVILAPGDVITCRIDGLGELTNTLGQAPEAFYTPCQR